MVPAFRRYLLLSYCYVIEKFTQEKYDGCKLIMNEGHFNFVCTGVCGHRIGKLTHPQTKAGPSINKNTPILRLFTTEID